MVNGKGLLGFVFTQYEKIKGPENSPQIERKGLEMRRKKPNV